MKGLAWGLQGFGFREMAFGIKGGGGTVILAKTARELFLKCPPFRLPVVLTYLDDGALHVFDEETAISMQTVPL